MITFAAGAAFGFLAGVCWLAWTMRGDNWPGGEQ